MTIKALVSLLAVFQLLSLPSWASDATDASDPAPQKGVTQKKPISKSLKFGAVRGPRTLVRRVALMQGRVPPPRHITQTVAAPPPTQASAPLSAAETETRLFIGGLGYQPLKTMCQTIFFFPSPTPLIAISPDYSLPQPTHIEPHLETRNHLMWTVGGVHHTLQLKTLGGIKAGEYEAFGKVGEDVISVTSQATFDAFVREVFRVMAFDPSIELALARAELALPYIADNEVTVPLFAPIRVADTISSTRNAQRYIGTVVIDKDINEGLHLESPGILVWIHKGVRHELHLRQSRDAYKNRGTYRALAHTQQGLIDVTCDDLSKDFIHEIYRVIASDKKIERALRFAGISY